MEYTIQKLAKLAGVSTRTLRYYDQIGLLKPKRVNEAGYRLYGQEEVDALQQVLFYRELGMCLTDIEKVIHAPSFDRLAALREHAEELRERQNRLLRLIETVDKTILMEEGSIAMNNNEKFEGFLQAKVKENEQKYGEEIRKKYGDATVDASNAKLMGLSAEDCQEMEALSQRILDSLEEAVRKGEDPTGKKGEEIVAIHKKWLCYTWPKYSEQAHLGLTQMYVEDERFTAYYDKNLSGCAAFLRDAAACWLNK